MAVLPRDDRPGSRLVSFEGIDGAGKSTLVPLVEAALVEQDVHAVFTREETATFLGDTVRRAVSEGKDPLTVLHLFLADRIQHLRDLERPLRDGQLVVTDRYHDSTRAYQSVALADRFEGIDRFEAWLELATRDWLIVPVRTYLLDVDVASALRRMDSRSEKGGYEKKRFLEQVRARYLQLAREDPDRWVVLDARENPTTLTQKVVADLEATGLIPHPPA